MVSGKERCIHSAKLLLYYGLQDWWSMTRNVDLQVIHVRDTTETVKQLNHTIVSGSTLVLDFPFFHHPVRLHLLPNTPFWIEIICQACTESLPQPTLPFFIALQAIRNAVSSLSLSLRVQGGLLNLPFECEFMLEDD